MSLTSKPRSTARRVLYFGLACLAAYAIYHQVGALHAARVLLHPAPLRISPRPAAAANDPAQLFPERAASQVAIFLAMAEPGPEAPIRCLKAMGIPFFVTRDLPTALRHKLVLLYPEVDGTTFALSQGQAINDFVTRGGVLFAQNIFWGGFKPLFGFMDVASIRTRHKITFSDNDLATADPVFRYLNRPEEKELPLGSTEINKVIWTNGYTPAKGTQVLAHFDDGSAAVLRHDVGRGHAYLIGAALNDLVRRNQQNRDFEAQRIYVNGFEPGTDIWLLILRAWYETYSDSGVRLGTIPAGKKSMLMLTHDVDWEYSFQPMVAFANLEQDAKTSSTFFVQTKYLDDATSHAFFFGQSLNILRQIMTGKSDIGSHTVIHSRQFNKVPLGTGNEKYPDYHAHATRENPAQDATALGEVCVSKSLLDGELPGHQTIVFRAGHLRVPPYLPEALVRCGYEFDSSFTAGDTLTNFPYELDFDLDMANPSGLFEFPVTFEDEQLPPLQDRVPSILATIEANAENAAPSVLLIHTNNAQGKLDAERKILAQLPHDILTGNMTEFARFWKARDQVRWFSRSTAVGEEIELDVESPITGLTLVSQRPIKTASGLPDLQLADLHWTDHEIVLPALAAKSHIVIHITY
jgi:hypothetical protein